MRARRSVSVVATLILLSVVSTLHIVDADASSRVVIELSPLVSRVLFNGEYLNGSKIVTLEIPALISLQFYDEKKNVSGVIEGVLRHDGFVVSSLKVEGFGELGEGETVRILQIKTMIVEIEVEMFASVDLSRLSCTINSISISCISEGSKVLLRSILPYTASEVLIRSTGINITVYISTDGRIQSFSVSPPSEFSGRVISRRYTGEITIEISPLKFTNTSGEETYTFIVGGRILSGDLRMLRIIVIDERGIPIQAMARVVGSNETYRINGSGEIYIPKKAVQLAITAEGYIEKTVNVSESEDQLVVLLEPSTSSVAGIFRSLLSIARNPISTAVAISLLLSIAAIAVALLRRRGEGR